MSDQRVVDVVVEAGGTEPPPDVPPRDVVEVVLGAVVDAVGWVDAGWGTVVDRAGGGATTMVVEVVGAGGVVMGLGAAGVVG